MNRELLYVFLLTVCLHVALSIKAMTYQRKPGRRDNQPGPRTKDQAAKNQLFKDMLKLKSLLESKPVSWVKDNRQNTNNNEFAALNYDDMFENKDEIKNSANVNDNQLDYKTLGTMKDYYKNQINNIIDNKQMDNVKREMMFQRKMVKKDSRSNQKPMLSAKDSLDKRESILTEDLLNALKKYFSAKK